MVRLSPDAWSKSMKDARSARARRPDLKPTTKKADARAAEAKAKAEAEKKKEAPKNERLRGQIVEVPPTPDDSPNPDAKYLSKYNSNVEKETTARQELRDSTKKRVTNKLQEKERVGSPENAMKTRGLTVRGDNDVANKKGKAGNKGDSEAQFKLKMPDMQRRDEVALKLSDLPGRMRRVPNRLGTEEVRGNSDRFELQMGKMNAKDGDGDDGGKIGDKNAPENELPSLAALAPTIGTIARISGSPSRDYVEGVQEGEGTFLNTKEFKHATFFYRVRDSVATYWEDLAAREYRRRDPSGNIYGVRDRSTLLHIQLAPDGTLANVRVEQTSGVDFLDNVAVQAFKMAEPFPNPPAAIVDPDGRIRFNFQFVVTMRSRSPMNLFNFR
ncbi:MAG: energy transducer TonB [Deltaproteobacteria bacterium]